MKNSTLLRCPNRLYALWTALIFSLASFLPGASIAQNVTPCYKPLIGPGTQARVIQNGTVSVDVNYFSPLSNITDGNTGNYASNQNVLGVLNQDGVSVLSSMTYPAGWRAGFVVEVTGGLTQCGGT